MEYGFADSKAEAFPPVVQLTVTNVCDMECQHCWHPAFKREPEYKPSFLSDELYYKVIDECAQYPNSCLRFFGWGEPLLHPKLPAMVSYAKKKGVTTTNLITNGLKLTPQASEALLLAGLDILEVSIDAATPETYALVRGRQENFRKVVHNTEQYIAKRDALKAQTYVTVSIIRQPKAMAEIDAFVAYWKNRADEIIFREFHDFMGQAKDKNLIVLGERPPCRVQWSRVHVNTEGLVSICFNDWHNENVLGDLKIPGTNIATIWNSEAYRNIRESHLNKDPQGICAKCNCWNGASWSTPYELLIEKSKRKQSGEK